MIFWIVAIILFYFLAILQSSFFVHFSLFGAFPNLIFILYFLLVFFEARKKEYNIFAYAVIAGLLLDIFYQTFFGISVAILLIAGFSVKKIQSSLQEKNDKFPIGYFLLLFTIAFIIYQTMLVLYLRFIDPLHVAIGINWQSLFDLVYNLVCAAIGFYIYKKVVKISGDDRQLRLFQ